MKTTFRRLLSPVLALALILAMAPGVFAASGVEISAGNFPDNAFRSYVSTELDKNKDGSLSAAEIEAATQITVAELGISTLKGIEFLTEVTYLNCENNDIEELDLSANADLTTLFCSRNKLSGLDLSKNTELTYASCSNNSLTSLDVSKNIKLESLLCESNKLAALDIGNCVKLGYLYCDYNELSALDLSKNTELRSVFCCENELDALDVSKNTKLETLYCWSNKLTSLDVSKNPDLVNLCIDTNELSSIDVSKNTKLHLLYCVENELTELDLSKNTKLCYLAVNDNHLSTLDISNNTALYYLSCQNNDLSALDVTRHPDLSSLSCYNNPIGKLDVSKNPMLSYLDCFNCDLGTLDVSKNPNLYSLNCATNGLTALDVSKNPRIQYMHCECNSISELDLSNCVELKHLYCYANSLTSLDIGNNADLCYLNCYDNQITSLNIGNNPMLLKVCAVGTEVTEWIHSWEYSTGEPDWEYYYLGVDKDTEVLSERSLPGIRSLVNGDTKVGIIVDLSNYGAYSKLRIQRRASGESSWKTLTTQAKGSRYTDTTAKKGGETYAYRVSGYADGEWTAYSTSVKKLRNPFTDVSTSASYFNALMWAFNNGIVAGTSTSTFSPKDNCTRGQFALMLWRMNGKPSTAGLEDPFTDVKSSNGFYNGIVWCYNQGITAGTSATTFSPNDNITRWQMILMFWRMQGKPKSSLTENPFTDVKTTASYYKAALWAYENKITGVETFMPNDLCTRWQLVLFLYRLNNLYHYI